MIQKVWKMWKKGPIRSWAGLKLWNECEVSRLKCVEAVEDWKTVWKNKNKWKQRRYNKNDNGCVLFFRRFVLCEALCNIVLDKNCINKVIIINKTRYVKK